MAATRIQHRRGTAEAWLTANPVLEEGELGIETDTGVLRVGNGTSPWTDLAPSAQAVVSPLASEWQVRNPILGIGVVGIERDTKNIKVGDGVTQWNSLPYVDSSIFATKTFLSDSYVSKTVADNKYAEKTQNRGLTPMPLRDVDMAVDASVINPVATLEGMMWGSSGSTLYKSSDLGLTWVAHCSLPTTSSGVTGIIPTADGEVLIAKGNIYRSTGWTWSGTPSVTWALKVTPNGATYIQEWAFSGNGTKFITTEYAAGASFPDSRYARVSLDMGQTWNVVYDSVAVHGATLANASHLHGCCYDPWSDRFYISEGHGSIAGLYASEDNGVTWTRAAGLSTLNPSPTFIVPTDDGLVCASDSQDGGLYGVLRNSDKSKERFTRLNIWKTGRDGTAGFGVTASRDPKTGIVYFGYRVEYANLPPVIMAGTASAADTVYRYPSDTITAYDDVRYVNVQNDTLLAVAYINGTRQVIRARITPPGARATSISDPGNVLGGKSFKQSAIVVGPSASTAVAAFNTVVIGHDAKGNGGQNQIAIGSGATTAAVDSLAIGHNAIANTANATVIGFEASGTNAAATAVGYKAVATGGNATALGNLAVAASSCISIGYNAAVPSGGGGSAIQIGNGTGARNQGVAIGHGTVHTGNDSVTVGNSAAASGQATAIGQSASAGTSAVAVGRLASASTQDAVAIGRQSTASFARAVALGALTEASAMDQVAIRDRHIEGWVIPSGTPVGAPAAGRGRLWFQDNGSGKVQLMVRFPTGANLVIAVEP